MDERVARTEAYFALLRACKRLLAADERYMADDGLMYPDYLADAIPEIREAVEFAERE